MDWEIKCQAGPCNWTKFVFWEAPWGKIPPSVFTYLNFKVGGPICITSLQPYRPMLEMFLLLLKLWCTTSNPNLAKILLLLKWCCIITWLYCSLGWPQVATALQGVPATTLFLSPLVHLSPSFQSPSIHTSPPSICTTPRSPLLTMGSTSTKHFSP